MSLDKYIMTWIHHYIVIPTFKARDFQLADTVRVKCLLNFLKWAFICCYSWVCILCLRWVGMDKRWRITALDKAISSPLILTILPFFHVLPPSSCPGIKSAKTRLSEESDSRDTYSLILTN